MESTLDVSDYIESKKDNPRVAQLKSYTYAFSDMQEAFSALKFLRYMREQHKDDLTLYDSLLAGLFTCYARSFTKNDGVSSITEKQLRIKGKMKVTHREAMSFRHKVHAHHGNERNQIRVFPQGEIRVINYRGENDLPIRMPGLGYQKKNTTRTVGISNPSWSALPSMQIQITENFSTNLENLILWNLQQLKEKIKEELAHIFHDYDDDRSFVI